MEIVLLFFSFNRIRWLGHHFLMWPFGNSFTQIGIVTFRLNRKRFLRQNRKLERDQVFSADEFSLYAYIGTDRFDVVLRLTDECINEICTST